LTFFGWHAIIGVPEILGCKGSFFMMKLLRGKNLAHPGCLIGVTLGLIVGIVLAGILASVFDVAYQTVLLIWLGLTLGLGTVGWIGGTWLTGKFPALEGDEAETSETQEPSV
jgi:hypothetical protein